MLVVLSLASLLAARKYIALAEYATVQRSAPVIRKLQGKQTLLVWVLSAAIIGVIHKGRVVQESTPRQIYEQPADEFVAAFVGKSNLFCGTVLRADERFIDVQTDDQLVIRTHSSGSPKLPLDGDKVLLSIRPKP